VRGEGKQRSYRKREKNKTKNRAEEISREK
jgi:hypothetical protein